MRSGSAVADRHPREAEANAFALELLTPEAAIRAEVDHPIPIDQSHLVHALARKFGVEDAQMAFRLVHLGLLVL